MRSITTTLPALLLATVLGGCAAAPAETETSSSAESALMNTNGGSKADWCNDEGNCTCTGDADCNDMFGSGVCKDGAGDAICHINDANVPRCRCRMARLVGSRPWRDVVLPVGPIAAAKRQPVADPDVV